MGERWCPALLECVTVPLLYALLSLLPVLVLAEFRLISHFSNSSEFSVPSISVCKRGQVLELFKT